MEFSELATFLCGGGEVCRWFSFDKRGSNFFGGFYGCVLELEKIRLGFGSNVYFIGEEENESQPLN